MGGNNSPTASAAFHTINLNTFPMNRMNSTTSTCSDDSPIWSPMSVSDGQPAWTTIPGKLSRPAYLQSAAVSQQLHTYFASDPASSPQSSENSLNHAGHDQDMYGNDSYDLTDVTDPVVRLERRKAQNRTNQRAYRKRKLANLKKLEISLADTTSLIETSEGEKRELLRQLQSLQRKLESLQNDHQRLVEENELLRTIAQLQGLRKVSAIGLAEPQL